MEQAAEMGFNTRWKIINVLFPAPFAAFNIVF